MVLNQVPVFHFLADHLGVLRRGRAEDEKHTLSVQALQGGQDLRGAAERRGHRATVESENDVPAGAVGVGERHRLWPLEFPVGTRFGWLVTIGEVHKNIDGKPCVLVRCDCGRSEPFFIRTSALLKTTRPTRSCGCAHLSDVPVGTRFGHQVTTSLPRSESRDDGKPNEVLVDVRCDCGSDRPVLVKNLRNDDSTSCGCVKDHYAY